MDIYIKSFNRPYYLDRCLRSIHTYVKGDYQIKILDDGTPKAYLDRISALHPDAEILFSPSYAVKEKAIQDHINEIKEYDVYSIPSSFWIESISKGSEFFLLIEDDIWLEKPVILPEVEKVMRAKDIVMLRLSWLGNPTFIDGKKTKIGEAIEEVKPAISYVSRLVFINKYGAHTALKILDRLKLSSYLYRFGILKGGFEFQLPFYGYYAVASAFFNKSYWLHLWQGAGYTVNETHQLKKATEWFFRKRSKVAKTLQEVTQTSFISSTNNSYKEIELDMFRFNYYLNEFWLQGRFDALNNFPRDFDLNYIKMFIEQADDKKVRFEEWMKWTEKFKTQYRRLGCSID